MNKTITMTKRELFKYETVKQVVDEVITAQAAAKKLGITRRHVQRLKHKAKKGAEAFIHGNRGSPSNRRIDPDIIEKAVKFIKEKYSDFKPTFTAEKLLEEHRITLSKETARTLMTSLGLWKPRRRKENGQYRSWRPRKEHAGEMEQFDGSYHRWFEGRAEECCLLASIDDASGRITKAVFGANEGVVEVSKFWKEYVLENGKPVSIYLDKYSTYKVNHKNATDNKDLLTRFQVMMNDIDVTLITAHSPEAKGRVERLFGTLQDRLVKELRLAGVSDIEGGNAFLEKFIPVFNDKFGVMPMKKEDVHRPLLLDERKNIDSIFSVKETRKVGNDFTVRFEGVWLQLEEIQSATVLRHDIVVLEKRLDGTLHMSLRGKYLSFRSLPERPEKIKRITALVQTKQSRVWPIPSKDHPWRKRLLLGKKFAGNTLTQTH